MTAEELLPQIKAQSCADKHSENLMKWVRKHKKVPLFIAYSPLSCIDGKNLGAYDPSKTLAHQLYVGYGDLDQGFLHGSRLSEILCEGATTQTWAFSPNKQFVIIPDWWAGYIYGGKCFIDPEHRLYGPERWQVNDKVRICAWCKEWSEAQHLRREVKTVTVWEKIGG